MSRVGARADERGMAFLFLLIVMGALSGLLAVSLSQLVPPQAAHADAAEARLAVVRRAAVDGYLRSGSFAASLSALATQVGLPATGIWRVDPYGSAADLGWTISGTPRTLTVRSRGADGVFGNADDKTFALSEQSPGRERTRARLRLLRAKAVAWQAAAGSTTMSPTDLLALRTATRGYALAQREYVWASAARRTALTATMTTHLATIRALRTSYGITFPPRLTGAGGLMTAMGLSDTLARDGWSRALLWNEALAGTSRGADNRTGTTDDF